MSPRRFAGIGWTVWLLLLTSTPLPRSGAAAQPDRAANAPGSASTFTNPIVRSGADPWVIRWHDAYYLCQARHGSVWLTKAKRLHELGQGLAVKVWTPPPGTAYSQELWAPELHYLRGRWYIYVAADDGNNSNHRMYVLEGQSPDPQGAFAFKGKIAAPGDHWAIDGTVLQMPGERLYLVWSGWKGAQNVSQQIYIAPMGNPWTISGERACICEPEHAWEKRGDPLVNEGPQVLRHAGKLFIIYSASGSWGDDYCLGQLTWTGGDVLRRSSWTKKASPVFTRTLEVFGPGYGSFVTSPDGSQDWIVYHAAKYRGAGWNRNIRIQPFTWHPDGSPNFGQPIAAGVPLAIPSE